MICPECGVGVLLVVKTYTIKERLKRKRKRECPFCGSQYLTEETIINRVKSRILQKDSIVLGTLQRIV